MLKAEIKLCEYVTLREIIYIIQNILLTNRYT